MIEIQPDNFHLIGLSHMRFFRIIIIAAALITQQAIADDIPYKTYKGKKEDSSSNIEIYKTWITAKNEISKEKCAEYAKKSLENNSLGEMILNSETDEEIKTSQVSAYTEFNITCSNNIINFESTSYLTLVKKYEAGFINMQNNKFPKVLKDYEEFSGETLTYITENQ
ncbi:MAG: hypothetical protein KJ892_07005 [Gammaproteobacteria bacterium]|nr:hypothetical protein [Gammaproteobacteria bacterium]MBU2004236.1 hypothetical protein [Gammaproteobacteria bacterium]